MTTRRVADVRIAAFFETPQPDLPDRTFDAVRAEIHRTPQRAAALRPVRDAAAGRVAALLVAAAVVVAVGVLVLTPRSALGPGGRAPAPSPSASAIVATPTAPVAARTPEAETTFTSPLYGYTVTIPPGWVAAPAVLRWDGKREPGPDADVDKFAGPQALSAFGFAGPFDGTLGALVTDRIAATARDHSDTCPTATPDVTEPFALRGQRWVFLAWNCGALINQAVTVRNRVAYAFTFRDLGIAGPTDAADRAIFQSILDSVELPS